MRLLPDSMAGRIGGLLAIGLLITATATFFVSGWDPASRVLERIATFATITDRMPASNRPALMSALSEDGLTVTWASGANPPSALDFMSRHLARDVRVALTGTGITHINAAPLNPSATQIWIQLGDGTWLTVVVANERIAALATPRVALTLIVLVTGIALAAAWAARRVASPLNRFAAAAQRLGTDVDAPPMEDGGPGEIRRATTAFNQMQGRIRRLIEDRTLMLAAISHDLRTALTRLKLRTDFIDDPRQRAKALDDLNAMQSMLDSALAFARGDAAVERVVRVDLCALLQSLCDDFSDAGKPATFQGPLRLAYSGRPVALRRLFANLIENAVTYGGEAAVTLEEHGDTVEITVGDRGPGIPEALREKIFAPFFRLEPSRNRDTGGTGLGLTIARSIVHRHGGSIALEDRPGGGLLVRIRLPFGEEVRSRG